MRQSGINHGVAIGCTGPELAPAGKSLLEVTVGQQILTGKLLLLRFALAA